MKQLIIHIGRHKSGTSTLQKTLFLNRELLEEQGFYYPRTGIKGYGHHNISEPLSRKNISKNSKTLIDLKNSLLLELADIDASNVIISSEAFQNCAPSDVAVFFEDFDVKIVVYVRNKLDYLVSSYCQKVHATNYAKPVEEFALTFKNLFYKDFIESWQKSFANISVNIFDRNTLTDGDIVKDFISKNLNFSINYKEIENENNPSLQFSLTLLKLELNQLYPLEMENPKIYHFLSNAAFKNKKNDTKMRLSNSTVAPLLASWIKDDIWFANFFQDAHSIMEYKVVGSENTFNFDLVTNICNDMKNEFLFIEPKTVLERLEKKYVR